MSKEKDKQPADAQEESDLEREIRSSRKFSLADAIGRLGGGELMKGASPVPRKQQAEFAIERYLERHLPDSDGALELVLLRRVSRSALFLEQGYEQPLATLADYTQRLLDSEQRLQDFVHEVDREWGRLYMERPHFQRPGQPPTKDDPYSFTSVRRALSTLLAKLQESG